MSGATRPPVDLAREALVGEVNFWRVRWKVEVAHWRVERRERVVGWLVDQGEHVWLVINC